MELTASARIRLQQEIDYCIEKQAEGDDDSFYEGKRRGLLRAIEILEQEEGE